MLSLSLDTKLNPDLNSIDYKILTVWQEQVYKWEIGDVKKLEQRLFEDCDKLEHGVIVAAIKQWRPSLLACLRANDGLVLFSS